MNIGFIGTGIMGSRMATNLQKGGHHLIVHNRTRDKAESLINNGAQWGETPAQVAQNCELLITMLAHPQAVREMAMGEHGFLDCLPEGTLWVDCSTVNPAFSREMASEAGRRGLRFLDAPVAGSTARAESAQLVFFVGGNTTDVEAVQPLFDLMGNKVLHLGDHGMGMSLKLVLNHLLATAMLGFAEGLALGESLGIPQETLFNALIGGPVVAPFIAGKRPKIENDDYAPEFPLRWMHKDLQMVAQTAYESGVPMPLSNITKELYQLALQHGFGDEDFSAIYRLVGADKT